MPAARDAKSPAPDSAKQRAPTPAPAPLGPAGGLGSLAAAEWQLALDNPQAARPEALLHLQRAGGNRAVQRHLAAVQRAPAAGEAEAVGPQGGEVQTSLENELARARGGGHALPGTVQRQMSQAFGADFTRVRVHTGARADTLNRSLGARAFTLGSDVFFSRGAYNPYTSSGKHLLAHELTHVVQQGGTRGPKVQTKLVVGPAGDRYEQEADRIASHVMRALASPSPQPLGDEAMPRRAPAAPLARRISRLPAGGVIQGNFKDTISEKFSAFKDTAKDKFGSLKDKFKDKFGSLKAKAKDKLLDLKVAWWFKKKDIQRPFKEKIKKPLQTYFGRLKDRAYEGPVGDPMIDAMFERDKDIYAREHIGGLEGVTPDYADPNLKDQPADRHVVTLAVAQEDISWYRNIKALKSVAIKKFFTSRQELLEGKQDYVAKQILAGRGELEGKKEEEQKQLIEKFTAGLHDVGHAWVRLSTYVGSQLKELYTFGMYPRKLYLPFRDDTAGGYNGFIKAGPGQIRHPDVSHESDPTKAYRDYTVSPENFDKALQLAIKRYNSPPPYVLTGYNCTAFAREIVRSAGGSFPGSGILPGFAYTPGNLYWAIMKEWHKGNKNVYTNDKHESVLEQVAKDQMTRAEAKMEETDQAYARKYLSRPDPEAERQSVTLFEGRLIRTGSEPWELFDVMDLDADIQATAIDDGTFIGLWKAVPVEIGDKLLFVQLDDYQKAVKPKKTKAPEPDVDKTESDGLKLYRYASTTPPDNPELSWVLPRSDLDYLTIEEIFDNGWTAVSNLADGSWYYIRQSEYDALRNPVRPGASATGGPNPLSSSGKPEPDLNQGKVPEPISAKNPGRDPADYKAGKYPIPVEDEMTLTVADLPWGELDMEITVNPDEHSEIVIDVEDDLTSKYGVCRIHVGHKWYYAPLADIFDEDGDIDEDISDTNVAPTEKSSNNSMDELENILKKLESGPGEQTQSVNTDELDKLVDEIGREELEDDEIEPPVKDTAPTVDIQASAEAFARVLNKVSIMGGMDWGSILFSLSTYDLEQALSDPSEAVGRAATLAKIAETVTAEELLREFGPKNLTVHKPEPSGATGKPGVDEDKESEPSGVSGRGRDPSVYKAGDYPIRLEDEPVTLRVSTAPEGKLDQELTIRPEERRVFTVEVEDELTELYGVCRLWVGHRQYYASLDDIFDTSGDIDEDISDTEVEPTQKSSNSSMDELENILKKLESGLGEQTKSVNTDELDKLVDELGREELEDEPTGSLESSLKDGEPKPLQDTTPKVDIQASAEAFIRVLDQVRGLEGLGMDWGSILWSLNTYELEQALADPSEALGRAATLAKIADNVTTEEILREFGPNRDK